jgi:hypothetical protein
MRARDLTGKIFGDLTVLSRVIGEDGKPGVVSLNAAKHNGLDRFDGPLGATRDCEFAASLAIEQERKVHRAAVSQFVQQTRSVLYLAFFVGGQIEVVVISLMLGEDDPVPCKPVGL